MTLEEARKLCEKIKREHKIGHCEYREITVEGNVQYVHLTVKIKVNDSKED